MLLLPVGNMEYLTILKNSVIRQTEILIIFRLEYNIMFMLPDLREILSFVGFVIFC